MRKASAVVHRKGQAWTPEEDTIVPKLILTNRDIAEMLGRTEKGVKDHRLVLKRRNKVGNVDTCSDFEEYSVRSDTDGSSCSEQVTEEALEVAQPKPTPKPTSKAMPSTLLWFEDGRIQLQQEPKAQMLRINIFGYKC